MRPAQILVHLRKQPFAAIRVFLSDGSSYDVRHPEMAAVSRAEMVIGLEPTEDDVPDRFVYCDPVHITRIEPINGTTAAA
ncbi:MAG: hypothetical protein GY842_00400 [bacterium]|nr:hypothetical protein [bacterium]